MPLSGVPAFSGRGAGILEGGESALLELILLMKK